MPSDEQSHAWRHQRGGADEVPGIVQLGPGSGAPTSDPSTPAEGDLLVGDGETGLMILLPVSVPAANVRNVLGLDNGDTNPAWKTALDATAPANVTPEGAAAAGTSLVFSHRDHAHAFRTSETDTSKRLSPDGAGATAWVAGSSGGGPLFIPFGSDRLGQSFIP